MQTAVIGHFVSESKWLDIKFTMDEIEEIKFQQHISNNGVFGKLELPKTWGEHIEENSIFVLPLQPLKKIPQSQSEHDFTEKYHRQLTRNIR